MQFFQKYPFFFKKKKLKKKNQDFMQILYTLIEP
jgi:hypothetical protein